MFKVYCIDYIIDYPNDVKTCEYILDALADLMFPWDYIENIRGDASMVACFTGLYNNFVADELIDAVCAELLKKSVVN